MGIRPGADREQLTTSDVVVAVLMALGAVASIVGVVVAILALLKT